MAHARAARVRNVRRRRMRFRLQETVEGDGRRLGQLGVERFGPHPEVLEDTPRHIGLLDAGDEPHRALTTRTLQDIHPKGTLRAPPKDRFSSAAQSRRYIDRTDVDFGDAAGDDGDGNDGDGDDGDGDVFDTCGSAGGSAPSMVDAGRGTTLARMRLVGAKTPCRALIHHLVVMNRVSFASVGGSRGTSFSSTSTPVITAAMVGHIRKTILVSLGITTIGNIVGGLGGLLAPDVVAQTLYGHAVPHLSLALVDADGIVWSRSAGVAGLATVESTRQNRLCRVQSTV